MHLAMYCTAMGYISKVTLIAALEVIDSCTCSPWICIPGWKIYLKINEDNNEWVVLLHVVLEAPVIVFGSIDEVTSTSVLFSHFY